MKTEIFIPPKSEFDVLFKQIDVGRMFEDIQRFKMLKLSKEYALIVEQSATVSWLVKNPTGFFRLLPEGSSVAITT